MNNIERSAELLRKQLNQSQQPQVRKPLTKEEQKKLDELRLWQADPEVQKIGRKLAKLEPW